MKNVHAFRAIAAAALTVAAGLAGPVAAADMTADQILATSGVTNDTSFCGTKNITLGIHDGFGINGWSQSSMAAVRSEAAKCANVKQVVRIGQGDLQKSIPTSTASSPRASTRWPSFPTLARRNCHR